MDARAADHTLPRHPARGTPGKYQVGAIVGLGVFMSSLDSSIVNISLPSIARHFGLPLTGAVEWVVIAYLLTVAALLMTLGRLADMIGFRLLWLTGLVVFTTASAFCGAASSLGELVGFRALQGLGGAMLLSISPALLASAFPPGERGRAMGLNAVASALGVSAGPALGGLLTHGISWRAVFYANLPVGILAIAAAALLLPRSESAGTARFDPAGALLLAVGVGALTLALSFGQEWGWGSRRFVTAALTGALALSALPVVERAVRHPVVDLALFRSWRFTSANLSLVLSYLSLFSVGFLLPFYFEESLGLSTLRSGLMLTPLPLTLVIVGPLSGWLADRVDTRWLTTAGLSIAAMALVVLAGFRAGTPLWAVATALVFTGTGQGMFQSPNNSALLGAAPRDQQGAASGVLATGRVIGQSLSVALTGAIFIGLGGAGAGSLLRPAHGSPASSLDVATLQVTFAHAYRTAFLAAAVLAACGAVVAALQKARG